MDEDLTGEIVLEKVLEDTEGYHLGGKGFIKFCAGCTIFHIYLSTNENENYHEQSL